LGNFVSLDDLVAVHRPDALDHLFVIDPLAGGFVDLAKADRGATLGRRIDLHRNRHEREANLPLPISTCGHLRMTPWLAGSQRFRAAGVPGPMSRQTDGR